MRDTTEFHNTCFEAKLVVKNTQLSDEIEYSLSVRNEYGESEKNVVLRTTTPLSLPVVVAIVIVIFAFLIAFGMLVIVVIRRRRKANEHDSGDELKEEIDGKLSLFFLIINHSITFTKETNFCLIKK